MQKPAKTQSKRSATVERRTKETAIAATVDLDGTGAYDVQTGVGFLDHMIEQLARHSLIDITLKANGDLHIDQHHTTEDSGIVLGQAVAQALGDKQGIARYGFAYLPMDETLDPRRPSTSRGGPISSGRSISPAPRSARWTPSCSANGSRPSPSMPASRCMSRRSTARIAITSPRPAIRRSRARYARRSPSTSAKRDACPRPRAALAG